MESNLDSKKTANNLSEILAIGRNTNSSDIHITENNPPAFRIDGYIVRDENFKKLTGSNIESLIRQLNPDVVKVFESGKKDIDTSFEDEHMNRYRINIFRQKESPAMAIRLLNDKIPTMEELGLPAVIKTLANLPRGLVLITGPTGSGKSTTLAAMIDHINSNKQKHILTLEDPIEYIHSQKKSIVNQREVGIDSDSFHNGMRSALREDPDVIMLGELRDYESISLALTLAETGHTVFATLHTIGAADTINRMIDAFPSEQQNQVASQLSTSLQAVVSQLLVPKIEGGRMAVHEILIVNAAVSNNIKARSVHNIRQTQESHSKDGMTMLDSELAKLVNNKIIKEEVALDFVKDRADFPVKLRNVKRFNI